MSLQLPEQPSRNRSASTGDSGLPKHERKRQRLSENHENTETDALSTSANEEGSPNPKALARSPSTTKHATSTLTSPPQSPLLSSAMPDATSPQSKVTINTRPISSQSSIDGASRKPVSIDMKFTASNSSNTLSASHGPPETTHVNQPETISISSSECGSPVIQVAAPEDLDQDPSRTRWETVSGNDTTRRLSIRSGYVQRTFPFADQPHKLHTTIIQIAKIFMDGASEEQEIFQKVKQWLIDFVSNATDVTYEFFDEEREFWQKFPTLIQGLLKRRIETPTGVQLEDLVEFLVAFAQLTTLIVETDARKMRSQTGVEDLRAIFNPHCPGYLNSLQSVMVAEDVPLYETLHESLNYSSTVIVDMVLDRLIEIAPDRHLRGLLSLFESMLEFFPKRVAYIDQTLTFIYQAGSLIRRFTNRALSKSGEYPSNEDPLSILRAVSSEFLQSIDAVLDRAVAKQQPWLNIETCEKVIKVMSAFVENVSLNFPEMSINLVAAANVDPSAFDEAELANSLAHTAWRSATLYKFIRKGRMEVRVVCVQIMAQDLVSIYHEILRTEPRGPDHPISQFMIQFIRKNDIIRYLIGVDSHPQIIERCANIIGFLCVSQSYQNEDTDIIWETITESQDTRVVAAILTVFQQNLDNQDTKTLCHIIRKLLLVPFTRLDVLLLDFAMRLANTLNNKVANDNLNAQDEANVDESIIEFCSQMLRDACTPEHITAEVSLRIRSQVPLILSLKIRLLRGQLRIGVDRDLLQIMLTKFCSDFSAHNHFAGGSALVLSTVLAEATPEECTRIVEEHNIATLLIDDLAFIASEAATSNMRESIPVECESRFSLMVILIFRSSHTLTESLIKSLWTNVLSLPDLNPRLRSLAWSALANVFEMGKNRNTVLDIISGRYLSELSPVLCDSAVLDFVKRSVKYETYHSPAELMEPQEIVTIPGIERVWNIMLTVPPNTVEVEASDFIIEQYLDGERVMRKEASSIEATHLALIDRSVQLVIDAATHLKASTDTYMNDAFPDSSQHSGTSEIEIFTFQFHRSLLFLRKFLDTLKSRPRYTPAVNDSLRKTLIAFDKEGQTFEVTLQIIGHKSLASMQLKWMLGYENSGASVWQFLADLTGWSIFTMINAGKRLTLKGEMKSLEELGVRPGSLMISKVQGSPENTSSKLIRSSSPVDNKVMHHFDELYNLLELEDKLAREVFDFLRMFSSQEEVVSKLKSMSAAPDQVLPVDKPFKLMYYARALRSCIEDESFSSNPNTDFLKYGIGIIISVLPSLSTMQAELGISVSISQGLIEALVLGFRARLPTEASISYISDTENFNQNLLMLWSRALDVIDTDLDVPPPAMLVRTPFEAVIEGFLHDEQLWSALMQDQFTQCLERSLLSQPKRDVRQATLEVIYGLTGGGPLKSSTKNNEARAPRLRFANPIVQKCSRHLWDILLRMMGRAEAAAATCEEYFEALSVILRQSQPKLGDDDLQTHTKTWKRLLLAHPHVQVVGCGPQDHFTSSVGRLLLQASKSLTSKEPSTDDASYIHDLFAKFLFPPLIDVASSKAIQSNLQQHEHNPVLDMHTRSVLYELVLNLAQSGDNLARICDELDEDLYPKNFYFQIANHYDRQSLRSESGYSGLRNLSNTCYLNSLISQLFMNVEFRELVMNVNIIDHTKQKLVAELGKVFAYMQKSYEEAISPETAIDAITLWDGNGIDVSVQMDVDEFFNLLFDRLETQIIDPKVCHAFKGIYGGQLVQQIKSKECEHVSERLEPFAAVQVEIKGKASLEESLRAYIEGEVLQGENKYSCTGCGKHVDAIKRACLKTVPNHLIFNLKRFDYDIMTGMRCKVNDEFCFPHSIDMAPYTLETLSNPDKTPQKDIFELVGIIIHSGTAESGHYYSYIRQRPTNNSKEKSWVQFNDHDVTQFDPASINECCFGGVDFGAIQCPKFYNGYMLFYQRSTSIRAFEQKYLDLTYSGRIHLPAEPELETSILQHNELFLRSYVAQDPTHAKFVRILLQQTWNNDELRCSQGHAERVSKILVIALDYVSQISARWKEVPELEETMTLIRLYSTECLTCTKVVINWFMTNTNLVDNLVRSYYGIVRKCFATLAVHCWSRWTNSLRVDTDLESTDGEYGTYLRNFLRQLADGWEFLQRHTRSWEAYFGLLQHLIRSGSFEARAVIEANFLEYTLELIHVHLASGGYPKRLRIKYSMYLLQRERNRPFNHGVLIHFLFDLLSHVQLVAPESEHEDRTIIDGKYGLSVNETVLLGMADRPRNLEWLKKVIFGRQNSTVASQIVAHLCKTQKFDALLGEMLKEGIVDRTLYFASACLQPALVFVSHGSDREVIADVVDDVLASIATTDGQYSRDFLAFVQEILHISNEQAAISQGVMRQLINKNVGKWAPVLLTAPNDIHTDVRGEALELLNDVLFKDLEDARKSNPRRYRADVNLCRALARDCRGHIENTYLTERAPSIQVGQGEQILRVLTHCLGFFGESASDEDHVARITTVMEEFRARSEGIVESVTEADWNASSDLDAMSEVDNISDASN